MAESKAEVDGVFGTPTNRKGKNLLAASWIRRNKCRGSTTPQACTGHETRSALRLDSPAVEKGDREILQGTEPSSSGRQAVLNKPPYALKSSAGTASNYLGSTARLGEEPDIKLKKE